MSSTEEKEGMEETQVEEEAVDVEEVGETGMGEERVKKLREYGLVMCFALSVLGGVLLWFGKPTCLYLFVPGGVFLVLGLFAPKVLDPVERVWMKFADKLSLVVTTLVLCITFYAVIMPIGLLMRLFGKDFLGLKFEKDKESYWVEVEEDAPGTRPYTPY